MAALALCAGAAVVVSPWATLLALCGAAVLLRRVKPKLALTVLLCLGVSALRARQRLSEFDAERSRVRDACGAPQRCALNGSVETSPTWQKQRTSFTLQIAHADCETASVPPGTRVRLSGGPTDLRRGDEVTVVAQLAPIELLFNFDLQDPLPGAARRGITLSGSSLSLDRERRGTRFTSYVDGARAFVRERILQTYAPSVEPMARALVLGENDLDPDDDSAFRRSGLSHMLAVSGTHLVFAVLSLVGGLTALLTRWERLSSSCDVGRIAAWVGLLLSLLYADFAGGSGSAFRAAFMLCAGLLGRALGREGCPSRALAWSLLVGWLLEPLILFDISFLLSAAATAGLLVFGPVFQRPFSKIPMKVTRWVGTGIATTLAAMVPCAPLLALISPELTLAGILANVVAAPIGEAVALPLCLAHMITFPWPALEQGIALTASGALWVVRAIARESAAQHWLAVPVPTPTGYQLGLLVALGTALVLLGEKLASWWSRWLTVCAAFGLLLMECATKNNGKPSAQLCTTALAVGQGDANLVDLPDGSLLLIDGGGAPEGGADPGERVVLPALRARRRTRVDIVVLTHPHPDHFGGLLAVLREVEVGELWDTGQGQAHGAGPIYKELLATARARNIPIRRPASLCEKPRVFGGATLRMLAPCPAFIDGRGANDNSFVFSIRFGRRSFLFTGDAEHIEEQELVQKHHAELRADVLKIGHHGSRTSSGAALLAAVSPSIATISCGTRNRFGHPTPEVLTRLAAFGVSALRTDRDGGIRVCTDGSALTHRSSYSGTP